MRALVLAFLSLTSCSIIVRALVDRCDVATTAATCDGNVLITCDQGLTLQQDCGDLICNAGKSLCDTCGDGVVQAPEACDDGNRTDGDACENDCSLPACGNGITDIGEDCDNAGANSDIVADACRSDCSAAGCGDGVTDTGEQCDDGNASNADACRTTCLLPGCGDGFLDFIDINGDGIFEIGDGEQCDDGNSIEDDGCDSVPNPLDASINFPCHLTFQGCNNANAREVNINGDHELCYNRPQTILSLGNGSGAQSIVARDFDGDNVSDVITVKGNQDKIAVFLNDGIPDVGNLLPSSNPPTFSVTPGVGPTALVTADLNNDFKFDVITTNQGSSNISVLLNNTAAAGSVSFAAATVFGAGVGPVALAAGDVNNDGNQDVVTVNPGISAVNILLGNGAGGFGAPLQQSVGTNKKPVAVAIADIDADGDNDIITANQDGDNLTILVNNGQAVPTFNAGAPISVGVEPLAVVAADVEGDGDIDLFAANSLDNTVSILLNNGQGAFVQSTSAVGQKPSAIFVGDLNHDDGGLTPLKEIIVVNQNSNTVSILRAKESAPGTFAPQFVLPVGNKPVAIASTDFDKNTYFDFAVVNNGESTISVLYFTP